MNTSELVEWQRIDPENNLVEPWWTWPFMDVLKTWDLKDKTWLEFGGGRSTAWLRKKCGWVDTIDANEEWALQASTDCQQADLNNGRIFSKTLPDGIQELKGDYFALVPGDKEYDIISVDGIWRNECLQFAIDHFKKKGGILVVDNMDQDFVWISPAANDLMSSYECKVFVQPGHTNHEGKPWNTRYYNIPKWINQP